MAMHTSSRSPRFRQQVRRSWHPCVSYQMAQLHATAQAGLLRPARGGKAVYSAVKRPLRLMVEDVNLQTPADPAYVYSGYFSLHNHQRQRPMQMPAFTLLLGWTCVVAILI